MTKKIIFSGYYGSDNAGDEAILSALLKEISSNISGVKPVIISQDPSKTIEKYNVKAVDKTGFKEIIKNLRDADLLISGGGSLLQDVTGKKTIPYYLGIMVLARFFKVPVFFCGQGVGPIRSGLYKKALKLVLNRVNEISVRDQDSKALLEMLNIKKEIKLTADVAYMLKPPGEEKRNRLLYKEGIKPEMDLPLIGVSIRPFKGSEYLEKLMQYFRLYKQDIGNFQLILLPFKYPDDYNISREFFELGKDAGLNIRILQNDYLPEELLGIVSKMDVMVGVRLHSLIFAAIGNTLPLGISYDPKIEGFLKQLGLSSLGDINNFDPDKSIEITKEYISKKEQIEKKLELIREEKKEKAEINIKLALKLLGDQNDKES